LPGDVDLALEKERAEGSAEEQCIYRYLTTGRSSDSRESSWPRSVHGKDDSGCSSHAVAVGEDTLARGAPSEPGSLLHVLPPRTLGLRLGHVCYSTDDEGRLLAYNSSRGRIPESPVEVPKPTA